MQNEVNLRIKSDMEGIRNFLHYLEKENFLTNQSDIIEDDRKLNGYLVFVTAVPKQEVTMNE